MVFELTTIGPDGSSMVANHWSNDVLNWYTMDRWCLFVILPPVFLEQASIFFSVNPYWISTPKNVDWKGAGWYRITGGAGTKLADFVVNNHYHCGTHASGWMVGGHPTVFQGEVTRTVNFNSHRKRAEWTSSIKVINCNTHYVYYLEEVPHCVLGYCTA